MTQKKNIAIMGFFTTVCILVVVYNRFILTSPLSTSTSKERLQQAIYRLAGSQATDCGQVPFTGNSSSADACSVAAFKAKQPFYVRYDLEGMDSTIAQIFIGTSQGQIYIIFYDSDPSGGSGAAATITEDLCTNPRISTDKGRERITCE